MKNMETKSQRYLSTKSVLTGASLLIEPYLLQILCEDAECMVVMLVYDEH